MTVQEPICAVTGASGYLGAKLEEALTSRGLTVHKLTRGAVPETDRFAVPFSLDKGAPAGFFKDCAIDTLIHCAYDFRPIKWSDIYEINVRGSVQLMEQAKAEGVKKIVFISSASAFEGCRSLYGKAKLEIEKEAARLGAAIIRPGLIYGDKPGAMMGALTRVVKLSSVVPIIGNGKQILYLVHEDDLASLIYKLCVEGTPDTGVPIIAASENGYTLSGILMILANRQGKSIRLVPLPWRLCWGVFKVFELCGLRVGFRSDSVVSLINTNPDMEFHLTKKTGIRFRDFSTQS